MSKLAHSNQETMDQIEAQAIADEEAGKPQDPPERGGHAMTDTDALIEKVAREIEKAHGNASPDNWNDEARAAAVAVLKEIRGPSHAQLVAGAQSLDRKPNDPVRRQPLRCYESMIDVLLTQLEDTDHE